MEKPSPAPPRSSPMSSYSQWSLPAAEIERGSPTTPPPPAAAEFDHAAVGCDGGGGCAAAGSGWREGKAAGS